MNIKEIISVLEALASPALQENYDNAGLITGDPSAACSGILISLDATEEIVEEAIRKNCNLIVAHHPVVFKGLKKLNGKNYVERTVIKAIKNDISIYAIHTNLDNVSYGVNKQFAERLDLTNFKVLAPKAGVLRKLVTFGPENYAGKIRSALFEGGAGAIGKYSECSFNVFGKGTFKAGENADPFVGEIGKLQTEDEVRIEVIYPFYLESAILTKLREAHPYEEIAYYISELLNTDQNTGSGMIGDLEKPMKENDFMNMVKKSLNVPVIRHSAFTGKTIKKIALCGGAGFFLLPSAIAAGADAYITADVKYHEFFDAEGKILLADVGHYESEQFTIDLLVTILQRKFPNFAVQKTELSTNSVHYFV